MKPFSEMSNEELGDALRAIRPQPSPAFTAELDQRAAAGFPRRSSARSQGALARALAWLRDGSLWRLAIPAGGLAVAAIVVATVVISGQSTVSRDEAVTSGAISGRGSAAAGGAGAAAPLEKSAKSVEAEATEESAGAEVEGSKSAGAGAGAESAEGVFETDVPAVGGANAGEKGAAAGTTRRDVERAAQITIGTKPGEVGEAASEVFETVHAYDGIVLNSATQNGSRAEAEATFELLIPSGKVDDAMAAFSRIGEVVSRHETTNDITAPTVGAAERLQDSEARIEGLLAQLAGATEEAEREVVEEELDSERRHAAHLKAHLSDLKRRANLSRVSLRIVSGKGALSPGGSGGGDWGVGDALHQAGHLLTVAAGVAIIAFAVLAPLALILFLLWLAGRGWTRRARERALT
jgi:hypothetical protein